MSTTSPALAQARTHSLEVVLLTVLLGVLTGCQDQAPVWNETELRVLSSLQLENLPENQSASNQYASNPDAAKLGERIFFDSRFSLGGKLSCASCHQAELAFTDGQTKAKGVLETGRNTQGLLGVGHQTWFYWDGRKDSLWSQALVPFEAANEMASNRVQVLRIVGKDPQYRAQYEDLFGTFPTMVFQPAIPDNAGPWGNNKTRNNWFKIPSHARHTINKAYANIGKAVEAYLRTLPVPSTRFDHYLNTLLKGQDGSELLSENELAGLKLFLNEDKTHCLRCHNGPLFSNSDFHNIGSGNLEGEQLDFGRYLGVLALQRDEFNCLGRYSDAAPEQCHKLRFMQREVHDELKGAFKTPSLRYLNKTGPYFHDGRFRTLEAVLQHYLAPPTPESELPPLDLQEPEQKALLAFLSTLYLEAEH